MNGMQERLFLELRQTRVEIKSSLVNKQKHDWLTSILEEELTDIEAALKKMEDGKYGQCEISGEFLPEDLLKMMPTLRSVKDSECLETYFKKPLDTSFL
jgi:RNA polymerase-binding transcription factor DksA